MDFEHHLFARHCPELLEAPSRAGALAEPPVPLEEKVQLWTDGKEEALGRGWGQTHGERRRVPLKRGAWHGLWRWVGLEIVGCGGDRLPLGAWWPLRWCGPVGRE